MEGKLHMSYATSRATRFIATALAMLLMTALVGTVGVPQAGAVEQSSVINFESGLNPGDTAGVLSVGTGMSGADLGTVSVFGTNPDVPGNAAMVYDATCGGQTVDVTDPAFDPSMCSGDDADLYQPLQGNTLIITEDGDASDPDDSGNSATFWTFDFTAWGPGDVTVDEVLLADIDFGQTGGTITLFDAADGVLGVFPIPELGDNTKEIVVTDTAGVASMIIGPMGSGQIDDIRITADSPLIDLELTKDVSPAAVQVGEETTFTIDVVNQGPDDATGVVVTDTLPAGLTYVSDNAGGAYDGATGVWTIGDLAVGASVSMEFVVTVDEAGTFVNEAEVTAANEEDSDSTPGDGEGDDWDDAIVTATVDPPMIIDLELTKDVDPSQVEVGEETTFTISVVNQGPDDATGVVVTDTLPAGLTYVSDNAGGAYDGATGVWTIGDLAVGASVSMEFVVTVDEPGTFVNEAEVTAANEEDSDSTPGDGEGDDWDDAIVTAVEPPAIIDLELVKDVSPAAVQVGEETTFTIDVVNQGPDDATGVVVTDTLPAGLTYVSDNAGGAYDGATGVWTIGDLAVGASVSMEFVVTVDEAGTFVNEAEVTAANEEDSDSTPGDGEGDDWDDAIVTATVDPPMIIDLELTKDVDPSQVEVGEETTFTISVVNQGPDDATGVVVTDTLPAGLTYVSDNAGGAYDGATGVWTIGDLAVGASVSMEFNVTVDDVGIFVNEAEVTAANETDIDSVPGDGEGDDWDDAIVTAISIVEASSTIGDYVWYDDDEDGVQDSNEDPVSGVTVRITNQATNAVMTQVTNSDGLYLFSGLDAGTYLVEVLTSTLPDNHDLTTVGSYTVTVLDDESFLDADFGIVEILPVTGMEIETAALIGLLFLGMGGLMLGLEQGRRRLYETSIA